MGARGPPHNLDLEELQERSRKLERELAEKTGEANKFRQLLQEAQEDLSQDEVIFAAKVSLLIEATGSEDWQGDVVFVHAWVA